MSEQSGNNTHNSGTGRPSGQGNNNRRHNHRRRPQGPNSQQGENRSQGQHPTQPNREAGPRPQGQQSGGNNNRRRHNRGQNNRPRPQGPGAPAGQSGAARENQAFNIERIYEKYLNLLEQHLIARRKFHDLFYRADPAQKNKLERNFYNTMNEVREFENKMAPDVRTAFEKRNNGLKQDHIYTSNHDLTLAGEVQVDESERTDPHLLETQRKASYADDTEESVGTAEDYLKYKNLI